MITQTAELFSVFTDIFISCYGKDNQLIYLIRLQFYMRTDY